MPRGEGGWGGRAWRCRQRCRRRRASSGPSGLQPEAGWPGYAEHGRGHAPRLPFWHPAAQPSAQNSRKWGGEQWEETREETQKEAPLSRCQPGSLRVAGDLGRQGPLVFSSLQHLSGLGNAPASHAQHWGLCRRSWTALPAPTSLGREAGGNTAGCSAPGPMEQAGPKGAAQNCSGTRGTRGEDSLGRWDGAQETLMATLHLLISEDGEDAALFRGLRFGKAQTLSRPTPSGNQN